ncbi:alkaline phosphatase family protein [Bacillus shivajii]|uniref:alkaline phosphatase family protein n=1 Tax=Bacillus shivajii TaxID=1983719 RepID=UPI001CFA187B|nr:alkaline phosphatase family protein [Bacillus shivajii]UCZ54425.1 alkaline phosphatase family protein [Bacillus shivajii]
MRKLLLLFILLLSSCQNPDSQENTVDPFYDTSITTSNKKVIMVMIDSMMGSSLNKSMEEGNVPALQYLIKHGQYYKDLVVPFPSMSVTVESTLVTGEMPDKHQVPGLSWFKKDEDRIVNYGTTPEFWMKNGFSKGIYDVFYNLNNDHLNENVTTIFEELDTRGFSSGAINTLLYRGNHEHTLHLPEVTNNLTDLPEQIQTKGPTTLAFGEFTRPESIEGDPFTDGIFHRFGLRDRYSMEVVQGLIENEEQPDFLFMFFPDNDKKVHKHGPHYRRGLEQADEYLQDVLNSYDSWEQAIEENIFIILGDHGADKLSAIEEELAINLENLAGDYLISPLGQPASRGDIAFGVNQRMSYIYDVQEQGILPIISNHAMNDSRIDLIAWLDDEWVEVLSPDHKGVLRFKKDGEFSDRYDQTWKIEGNHEIVKLLVDHDDKLISYTDYPDVLNHLETSLNSHDGSKLVLVAKPGHSFYTDGVEMHEDGGEHGGLHKNDLLTALVITGTDLEPDSRRFVDLKNFVLDLFEGDKE